MGKYCPVMGAREMMTNGSSRLLLHLYIKKEITKQSVSTLRPEPRLLHSKSLERLSLLFLLRIVVFIFNIFFLEETNNLTLDVWIECL